MLQQVESELLQVRKDPDYDAIAANVWGGAEDLLETRLNTLIEAERDAAAEGSGTFPEKGNTAVRKRGHRNGTLYPVLRIGLSMGPRMWSSVFQRGHPRSLHRMPGVSEGFISGTGASGAFRSPLSKQSGNCVPMRSTRRLRALN